MDRKTLSRRKFLLWSAAAGATAVSASLTACQPKEVIKEVTVVVKETVEVEKEVEVEVEKEVTKVVTQVVEKEKVVVATPAPRPPTEIRYLTLSNPLFTNGAKAAIEMFQEATGDTVVLEEANWPMNTTFVPLLAAGTAPDMLCDMGKMIPKLYGQGAFLDLTALFDSGPVGAADFYSGDFDSHAWVGKQFGAPVQHAFGLQSVAFYRKDIFDEVGLPYPERDKGVASYADLWAMADACTKRDSSGAVTRWGWESNCRWWESGPVLAGMLDQGTHWWNEADQVFNLDSQECIDGFQTQVFDPMFTYGVGPTEENQGPSAGKNYYDVFYEGSAAMITWGSTMSWAYQNDLDVKETIDWFELPGQVAGKHNLVTEGCWGNHIVASIPEANRLSASEFLMYFYTPEVQLVSADAGLAPPIQSMAEDPSLVKQAEGNPPTEVVLHRLRLDAANPLTHVTFEWGYVPMYSWHTGRCYDSQGGFISEAELEALCAELGSYNAGRMTAEQLCVQWQEMATKVRQRFFKEMGLEV
jgi:ABC-type glycerol-3-phosphate transport system substrate-binding protein